MHSIPLSELVEDIGQEKAGVELGVSQGAISKALKAERVIFVTRLPDGKYSAEEIKPFPSQTAT